jgi:hypothetical protein
MPRKAREHGIVIASMQPLRMQSPSGSLASGGAGPLRNLLGSRLLNRLGVLESWDHWEGLVGTSPTVQTTDVCRMMVPLLMGVAGASQTSIHWPLARSSGNCSS